MENLLSFLSVRLRQKGMTVNELCGRIGISRQKFYRFTKEPHRFPAESVRSIISALSLSEAETRQFESYFDPQYEESAFEEEKSRSPDLADYRDVVENLFAHHLSTELSPEQDAIEYTQAGRHVTILSAASFARILAGFSGRADFYSPSPGPTAQKHEYELILYNCVPDAEAPTARHVNAAAVSIRLIASIVSKLEDALLPSGPVKIRIKHYLTDWQIAKLKVRDPDDRSAMAFQLRILDTLLPLLSTAEDYRIETGDVQRNLWVPKSDLCLIRHVCRCSRETSSFMNGSPSPGPAAKTEYFTLLFTENGACSACRLGSDEVSHIYRYLSPDGMGSFGVTDYQTIQNPILELYERFKDCPVIMINPDLYFDDIPPRIWMALYGEIQKKSDRELYEAAFRRLIDPFDQFSFLSFEILVQSVLNTLEQRADTAARMGHCVLCHPDGLLKLVRTGMITDLTAGPEDYSGSSWSPTPLRFPAPLIRELLEMIRSSILRRQSSGISDPLECGWVNYYILHPQFPLPEISFHFYGGRGVVALYTKGRHKHTLCNLFDSPAAATILFDYVKNEMIGKRGEKLSSVIMSDEHSIALIDRLISGLDEA